MGKTDPPDDVGWKDSTKESQRTQDAAAPQSSMQPMASKQSSKPQPSPKASASSSRPRPPSKIAGGKFELGRRLGAGCFGEVYEGVRTESKEQVAIKCEALDTRAQQLEREANIMKRLGNPSQPQGFPECFWFGREGRYQCLVMERLDKSLEDILQVCERRRFKPLTAALVAEQLMQRIEYLHSVGIVHRDIKPENFMLGREDKAHHIYIIDFGLSKRYFDKTHAAMRNKLSLTGTARYASINAHKGLEQSRRDDLEAVGHMLLYFLRGMLPWSGLDAKTQEEKYRKICQKKEDYPLQDLCQGYPEEFMKYLQYCRSLGFTERPDYRMLHGLFAQTRENLGPAKDWDFEWLLQANIDSADLIPLNPWTPPKQPDERVAADRRPLVRDGCLGAACSRLCGGSSASKW